MRDSTTIKVDRVVRDRLVRLRLRLRLRTLNEVILHLLEVR